MKPTHLGFLHEHPKMQNDLDLPNDHVIVDKRDWLTVRSNTTSDSKPLLECDLFAVNFETNTIEISMPKNTFRKPVHAGKVKIDISDIMN